MEAADKTAKKVQWTSRQVDEAPAASFEEQDRQVQPETETCLERVDRLGPELRVDGTYPALEELPCLELETYRERVDRLGLEPEEAETIQEPEVIETTQGPEEAETIQEQEVAGFQICVERL